MLGKTANGLFWMFRYLERVENTARLVEAGLRMALTRSSDSEAEWASIIDTAWCRDAFLGSHSSFDAASVTDFLLRDPRNPSSAIAAAEAARNNGRLVRTALTREVWEATNDCWMTVRDMLREPVREYDLPAVLATIKQQGSLVRGALHGTMLRNEIFDFARLGTFIERADSTARILDVKYYVLLPSVGHVGSMLDNAQWESILRSVSAHRSYSWAYDSEITPANIADYLILNPRMPRSLAYCVHKMVENLSYIAKDYGERTAANDRAEALEERLKTITIAQIFDAGLHQFIRGFIRENLAISDDIAAAYRFAK